MRKGSRMHSNKKVNIIEEDEEEKLRKTEGKMVIIRAEFEKHKKEQMISVTEASKLNEVRLKNQLEELLTDNARKLDSLMRLENNEKKLHKQNAEDTQFYETISKFESSKVATAYLAVADHPNRTTTSIYGMNDENRAELLGDKMAQLMDTLNNIELMIEEEEEVKKSIHEKYEELRKDQILSQKKINELAKMNDHADKRFADLGRIEYLAHTKHAAATSDLKDLKDDLKGLKQQESAYKKQKEEEKKRESEYLLSKQTEMSQIMIEIDKKRHELQYVEEEVKRLELKHEEMRDKRKNTRIVTKYIDALSALTDKQTNLILAHQALREMSESVDVSRTSSPARTPTGQGSPKAFNLDGSPKKHHHHENKPPHVKRNSLFERNIYIEKIQRLYENHPEGPHRLADALIQQYLNHTYQEESLKSNYEELQNNKKHQENELLGLQDELRVFKKKNDYITLGKTGSKILDSNEQEAIDSGMLIVDAQATTLNQAKFDLENKKEVDTDTNLFVETEAFVLRCYMDSIEMISRFSKILNSINQQSGGALSEEMKELARLTHIQTLILKKSKKFKPEMSVSNLGSEVLPENKSPTDNSTLSEREKEAQDQVLTLDLNEVQEVFLSAFEDETEKAAEFVENLNNDVMIISFISIEDIRNYLESCKLDPFVDQNIQRALDRITSLRKVAVENMLQKFETIYKVYSDIITTTNKNGEIVSYNLKVEGVKIPQQDLMDREFSEPNEHMKKALETKWKRLLDRFDYDPARDFRKATHETETSDHDTTEHLKEKLEDADNPKEEIWDKEDTKVKLNEIVDARSRKAISKNKKEEEQRRLQAKKEKEKQKLAMENMSDDAYLNWQRNKIRNEGKDDLTSNELNENELLRKAQADLASRLSSSTAPMAELKRMIQNSKVLAKIQILERQKCITDGKRNLNHQPVDNYIPPEPVKVPKSPNSANQSFNPRLSRNIHTPSTKPAASRFYATSSDRMTESEYVETPKDMTSKSTFSKPSSKFKPIDARFDFTSEPTLENEKPQTQMGGRRLRTLNNFQTVPSFLSSPAATPAERQDSKPKKLLKNERSVRELSNFKPKSVLPKLEKNSKKKNRVAKKEKRNRSVISTDHDNIDHLLRIQTDPLLKMVYSPTFFAQTMQNSTYYTEDLGYRFDSFKFNTPGLLISEKVIH